MTGQKLSQSSIFRLRRIDWDFTGSYSESLFSAIHWHPSRIVSQVPAALIGLLSRPGDMILDPFVGSGTTIVEAQRLGRIGVGIELNPVAALITRAKTLEASHSTTHRHISRLLADALLVRQGHLYGGTQAATIPPTVQVKWYHPRALEELGLLWTLVSNYHGAEHALALASFSASLMSVCRERRHWGYVCDNVTPKGSFYKDAVEQYRTVLTRFDRAYQEREASAQIEGRFLKTRLYNADARETIPKLSDKSFAMVITSPPYFGVSDYIKAQRLSLEWLGINTEPLRLLEIGARSKRHRRTASADYRSELRDTFAAIRPKLKRRGVCVLIIGESGRRKAVVDDVIDDMKSVGYRLHQRLTRSVSVQRRLAPSVTEETMIVLGVA